MTYTYARHADILADKANYIAKQKQYVLVKICRWVIIFSRA